MLPPIKHFPVNWQDGMKITRNYFVQMENALADQIRDMGGIPLTNYNFGLLPPSPNTKQSLGIQIFYDLSEQVTVKVSECRAITPGGARIEIDHNSQPVEATILTETLKAQAYEIYLVVDPFSRVATGQPNPNETPLRQPYTLPQYRVEILPYPQTHQPEYSAFQLCIGRLRVEGDTVKLSEHYIPPCTALASHQRLAAAYHKLLAQLGETEVAVTGILQRIKVKDPIENLDKSLLYLTEKIAGYLANSLDTYRLFYLQQPPLQLIAFFSSFARIINVGLNSLVRKEREELLDYFHKWFELPPREMENLLRTLITLTYDHNDSYSALNKVEQFSDRIIVLLKKLNELNYVAKTPETEKIYGWLALHTEGRERSVFKIKEENTLIGRQEGGVQDIDFAINDDHWISRRHARLIVQEENGEADFQLMDLNSNNGTYIHDTKTRLKPNEEFSLIDGDTFQVGKTNIVIKSAVRAATEKDLKTEVDKISYYEILNIKDLVVG